MLKQEKKISCQYLKTICHEGIVKIFGSDFMFINSKLSINYCKYSAYNKQKQGRILAFHSFKIWFKRKASPLSSNFLTDPYINWTIWKSLLFQYQLKIYSDLSQYRMHIFKKDEESSVILQGKNSPHTSKNMQEDFKVIFSIGVDIYEFWSQSPNI